MGSSDTQLTKVQFQNGINKNTTKYNAEDWWVDCDKVRFRNGRPEKIGGWVRENIEQAEDSTNNLFTGIARDVHVWTDLNFNQYFAVGTHRKVEQFFANTIYDITPYRKTSSLTDKITTVNTESEVSIQDTNHGTVVGDFVYVDSQASTVNGIDLLGEYTVTEVTDADNFKIDSGTAATGSGSGGGVLEINYLLEAGDADNGNVTGYGGGTWDTPGLSSGGYDRPRDGVGGTFLRQWSFDNWGEDLVACNRGGKIYNWDATTGLGSRLEVVANAPEENYMILVGQPYRHLIAFGTVPSGGSTIEPLTIRWPEQESQTAWTITATNTAGEYRLPLGNYIVSVIQTKSEIIIFTDTNVYSMRYVGGNEVFAFDILANNVTAVSQHCGVDANGLIYWMGIDNFYMYDGVVRPLESTLDEFIFDQDSSGKINFEQKEKVYCSTNNEFNEIIWLYPSELSDEPDRYIIYNYVENSWYDGTMERTVWLDRSIYKKPYALDPTGKLFIHEEGKDDDATPMLAYIESGDIALKDGNDMAFVDRFVPDFKLVPNRNADLILRFKDYPNSPTTTKGPYRFNNDTGKISLRGRGRHITVRYEVNVLGADFEVGAPRFAVQPDGGR